MKRPTIFFKVKGATIPGIKSKGSLNIPENSCFIIWKRRKRGTSFFLLLEVSTSIHNKLHWVGECSDYT